MCGIFALINNTNSEEIIKFLLDHGSQYLEDRWGNKPIIKK